MIVLRITVGSETHEIRTEKRELLLGSDPTADFTLADAGWGRRELALRREGSTVLIDQLDGAAGLQRRLRVGDAIAVGNARIQLAGMLPQEPGADAAPVFGGYDEGAPAATFEVKEPETRRAPRRADAPTAASTTAGPTARQTPTLPRADKPQPKKRPAKQTQPTAPAAAAAATTETSEHSEAVTRLMARQQNFGDELYQQLKRAPFFMISCAVHALIFVILMLIPTNQGPANDGKSHSFKAAMVSPDDDVGFEEPHESLPEMLTEDSELPETPEIPDEPSPLDQKLESDRDDPPLPEPDGPLDKMQPVDIGLAPRHLLLRPRSKPVQPNVPKQADLEKKFTDGSKDAVNKRAADIVRSLVGRGGAGRGDYLKRIKKKDILVISGAFDHMHKVLDALELPYTKKDPYHLISKQAVDFEDYKCLFWNCGEALPPRHTKRIAKRVRDFVKNGGYLFTTDWGIDHVLVHALPGYVRTRGSTAPLAKEYIIDIAPAKGRENDPLLKGVFLRTAKARWWLEQSSYDVLIKNEKKVKVLIESAYLRDVLLRGNGAVVVTFEHGNGRVLHAMGHYFQEAGNLSGTIASQRLALNFVLERLGKE